MNVQPPPGFELETAQQKQPQLTPVTEKSVKSKGGKTYNVGDHIPGHGKIKGFSKDASGSYHAHF